MKKVAITILCLLGVTLTAMAQLVEDALFADEDVSMIESSGDDALLDEVADDNIVDIDVSTEAGDDFDIPLGLRDRDRRNRRRNGRRVRSVLRADEGESDQASLAERWKSAKSDSAKSQIVKTLTNKLSDMFDDDMKRRKMHIAEIERRLDQLKALYEKREKAKAQIVKLQTQSVTMSWEGLGFARPSDRGKSRADDLLPRGPHMVPADEDINAAFTPEEFDLPAFEDLPDENSNRESNSDILGASNREDDPYDGFFDDDVAGEVVRREPIVGENDDADLFDIEDWESFRKANVPKASVFVRAMSDDPSVRKELADILLMVMHAGERKSSEVFHGSVLEAYHRSMQLQKRGEQIPGTFFATIAKMTEQKAKKVNPDDKADYVHLLARMHHASGNMERAKSLSEHLVWHAPDNREYVKFLKELQWETDAPGGSLPQLEVPSLDSN